jgi:hypothetical protein
MVVATAVLLLAAIINGFFLGMGGLHPVQRPSAGAGAGLLGLLLSYGLLVVAVVLAWRALGWLAGIGFLLLGLFVLPFIVRGLVVSIYSQRP